jgi:hypothetical protein
MPWLKDNDLKQGTHYLRRETAVWTNEQKGIIHLEIAMLNIFIYDSLLSNIIVANK